MSKLQLIKHAQFATGSAVFDFKMFRKNAGSYVFTVTSNTTEDDAPEYSAQLNSQRAPDFFLAEIVTFMANRFQVKLELQPPPDAPPPPPPPTSKLQIVKGIPEELK